MSDREAFEKWVNANPGYTYWDVWQAAQAQASDAVAIADKGVLNWLDGKKFDHEADLYTQPAQVNQQLLEALQPLRFDVWADHYEEDRLWYEPCEDGSLLYYGQVVAAIAAAHGQ